MSAPFKLIIAGSLFVSGLTIEASSNSELIQISDDIRACTACGDGIYVAVYRTNILTSQDKTHWTPQESASVSALFGIAFGAGKFVAVGNEGLVMTSPDGQNWQIEDSSTDERLRGVSYGNGMFVAVGYSGTIITSRDGRAWIRRISGTGTRLQSVVYANGYFLTVGWKGTVLTSRNAANWRRHALGIKEDLVRVSCSDDGRFLAAKRVSDKNVAWTSLKLELRQTALK